MTRIGSSDSDPDGDPAKAAAYIRLSSLGFQVVITFVVLALGGAWLDGELGISPWGTLGGVDLGILPIIKIILQAGTQSGASRSGQRSNSDQEDSGEAVE